MNQYDTLKTLSELNGVPGREKEVRDYLKDQIKNFVDKVETDRLGSLIGYKNDGNRTIMLAGHMDEVGLMVSSIDKNGFIKFQTLGGWYSQVMLAQEWQIITPKGVIFGVTGVKPPHILSPEERTKAAAIDSMYIDIGVSSDEEAMNLGVKPGQMITPYTQFRVLGNGKYLLGKAWDNRIGSAVVLEVSKRLKEEALDTKVAYTFTVQEEVGLRGAKTSSYMVRPDVAIAIDTGLGNDTPGLTSQDQTLGKGPQILLLDGGLVPHQGLRNFIIEVAKEFNIPFQEGYIAGGRTDAGNMHLAHQGALSVSICIPTRNMHSHTSIIHYDDFVNTVELVYQLVKKLNSQKIESLIYE